ncbi:OmpA family protein [Nonlabens mediterrranea]|uniref:OmpA family protein n=2 Tax=Nonlabens mediterrranea TaxID=1419947 RepID=A0ABS0A0E6_9FLAO|nr:OmpA family protein [Nonlabens mediterrranea]
MKLYKPLLILLILLQSIFSWSQVNHATNNYFQISPRIGYDFPSYHNNMPYIDYNGGLEAGISVDYYWNWIGVGIDVDYIKNSPESIYPTNGLIDFDGSAFNSFNVTEDGITRLFYGIGPNFQYRNASRNFSAEFNSRIGLASIKGGRLTHEGSTANSTDVPLNFHAGYDVGSALTFKLQTRLTYFFNPNWGIHAGAYYMRHLNVTESIESGVSTGYHEFNDDQGALFLTQRSYRQREEPCDCDISSVGIFAGVTFKLNKHDKEECQVCDKYNLTVIARDKFTKELLPDTEVVLKDTDGNIVQTGTSNSYGAVVFNDIKKDDYTIEGKLYDVNLEGTTAVKNEFKANETLQKEIVYSDLNFILKGNAVVCNTTTALDGVSVILNNLTDAEQKNTITNIQGEFIFNVKQKATYSLRGKKANYFSQTETISTENYDRSTTLFVKLEVCLEEADCGKAIALKNILYDLDKYYIRADAEPELNRLVQFMKDNPGVRIEISSHTDSRGSNAYNKTLSQNRASAARDYIASQGIDANRVVGIGYGETRLLNRCADGIECSAAEHQINRRTEMKVICPK